MCGIGVVRASSDEQRRAVEVVLARRGPDALATHSAPIDASSAGTVAGLGDDAAILHFIGAVLHLRGAGAATVQPATDHPGFNILLFNGEVFGGPSVSINENDTRRVYDLLNEAASVAALSADRIVRVLESIEGPFAVIFWQASERRLWFGRDPLGRRSLLAFGFARDAWRQLLSPVLFGSGTPLDGSHSICLGPEFGAFALSSAAAFPSAASEIVSSSREHASDALSDGLNMLSYLDALQSSADRGGVATADHAASMPPHWMEVPPVGLYALSFPDAALALDRQTGTTIAVHPWRNPLFPIPSALLSREFLPIFPFDEGGRAVSSANDDDEEDGDGVAIVDAVLKSSREEASVLPSNAHGGGDHCELLLSRAGFNQPLPDEHLTDDSQATNGHLPRFLVNALSAHGAALVASATSSKDDCLSSNSICDDGRAGTRGWNQQSLADVFRLPRALFSTGWTQDAAVDAFILTLTDAVRRRVSAIPPPLCSDASSSSPSTACAPAASVGVLFSGGIDCALLALLAARCMAEGSSGGDAPTLDLINVAFGPEQSAVVPQSSAVAAASQSHGRTTCQCRANPNPEMASSAATNADVDAFRWFDVPDRLAAVNSLCELNQLFPSATLSSQFRLIEVNVSISMLQDEQQRVLRLIHPNHTIMDFNIGAVLYFGSRAQGVVRTSPRSAVVSHKLRYGPPLYSSASLSLSASSHQPQPQPSREEAAHQRRESDRRRRELLFAQRKERDALRFQHLREKLEPASTKLAPSAAGTVSEFSFPDSKATAAAALGSDDSLNPAFILVDNGVATGVSPQRIAPPPPAADQLYRSVAEKSSNGKKALRKAERKLHASVSVESSASASGVSTAEDGAVCETCGGLVAFETSGANNRVGAWNEYRSACKVLLVGLGADEQLGGYGRHRVVHNAAYSAAMKQSERAADGDVSSPSSPNVSASTHAAAAAAAEVALRTELLKDTARLWRRNLGRDDRCVSDHGREARHPFLDERVVALLRHLPSEFICDLRRPAGACGDKRILRLAAARLGLVKAATLQKRALQFGTRIANKDVSGTVTLDSTIRLCEIVNQRALRPLDVAPGGRARVSDKVDKKTVKRIEREMAARNV